MEALEIYSTQEGYKNKHSSLFVWSVSDDEKSFITFTNCVYVIKLKLKLKSFRMCSKKSVWHRFLYISISLVSDNI
jgi:hypothetical protein